ncbi:MAG: hypothetical protein J6386_07015 [Candidatus Synoicihabitans palmerolidicus]|nr:hypothetical protein [Candidatus Synoicihabitans palmerolidicus]
MCSSSGNWLDETLPASDGTSIILFDSTTLASSSTGTSSLDTPIDISGLIFEGEGSFTFAPDYFTQFTAPITLRDGLTVTPLTEWFDYSEILFDYGTAITTDGDTIGDIGYGAEVEIAGGFANEGSVTLVGSGTLLFSGSENLDFNGTVVITNGILGIGSDDALGSATLMIGALDNSLETYPGLIAVDADRTISNDVVVTNYLLTEEDFDGAYEINFAGDVTLNGDTLIENSGGVLSFEGKLLEATPGTTVTVTGYDAVLFGGTIGFTGGLHVDYGAAIFNDDNALPSTSLFSSNTGGYIGIIEDNVAEVATTMTSFLEKFDLTNTLGTIGFDTDPVSITPIQYGGNIDLTGFDSSVRIGSATFAELTGTLTPAGSNYRFGNGGGFLLVGSTLTDDGSTGRGIEVISNFESPLRVYINSSANRFTGSVYIEDSAVIFGNAPGSLPSAATLTLSNRAYIGIQDTTMSVADYLDQFDASLNQGIIGFDSSDQDTTREITAAIDLNRFTSESPNFYLGASTLVELSGAIMLPDGTHTYRFSGYKGGFLNIASDLTDGETPSSVVIGDSNNTSTGYFQSATYSGLSGVALTGTNTYTGGTELQSGELVVDSAASLGTGSLNVSGGSAVFAFSSDAGGDDFGFLDENAPVLSPQNADLVLGNAITLNGDLDGQVPFDTVDLDFTLGGGNQRHPPQVRPRHTQPLRLHGQSLDRRRYRRYSLRHRRRHQPHHLRWQRLRPAADLHLCHPHHRRSRQFHRRLVFLHQQRRRHHQLRHRAHDQSRWLRYRIQRSPRRRRQSDHHRHIRLPNTLRLQLLHGRHHPLRRR